MSTSAEAVAASFADLGVPDDLADTLDRAGITEPFAIQTLTIPDAMVGRDICGQAQTGSGKTLAFGLPLATRTTRAEDGHPRSLVLVPTRELCSQVAEELDRLAKRRGLRLVSVYGGVSMDRQINAFRDGADIIVATPGRLIDLIERRKASVARVQHVVIDEADQMADMGFLPQVHRIMSDIPEGHQTMLFSATLDGQVRGLINRYLTDPVRHEVEASNEVVDGLEHRFIQVHHMDKPKLAAAIADNVERTLIFVRTKRGADRVAHNLVAEGVDAAAIHGDLRQSQREKTLAGFAKGDLAVLVATNVAARGLHIDDIDIVVHYDPPDDYKSFVHRSGRTARAGSDGLVVTLVEWDQIEEVQRLQRASGLHTEITKMFSNDPRLANLTDFQPEAVEFKRVSNADISRRFRTRKRRR